MKTQKSQVNLPQFKNKKILIMGLGLHDGGVGAVKFFAQAGAKVTATDLRTKRDLQESINQLKNLPIKYILGKHREKDFKNADLIIRNPAVSDNSPYLKIARKYEVPIDTDIGIFFELLASVSPRTDLALSSRSVLGRLTNKPQIIGVTGTRGKSTTATLIYEMLKTKYPNAVLAGNIRKSVLLELPRILKNCHPEFISGSDKMLKQVQHDENKSTGMPLIILELSSWQLEGLSKHKMSPHIAIITTIQPDHLNRYKNMKEYMTAKKLIFKCQAKDDFLFLNKDDKIVRRFAKEAKSKVIFYGAKDAKKYETRLLGNHNLINIAAAVKIAKHFGIGKNAIKKTFKNFKGLTGRLELIAKINGVKYINDTCATTPDAAIAAINAVTNHYPLTSNHLILIAGGADKNLDFKELAQLIVKKVKVLILLGGTATDKLENSIKHSLKINPTGSSALRNSENYKLKIISRVKSMEKAVRLAASHAKKGDTILLSPACASFGMFRHEFERGEAFKKAVESIK